MRFSGRLLAVVVAVAAVAVLAGCGKTVIDSEKTADTIEHELEKSLNKPIKSVECPAEVEVDVGSTFHCTVVFSKGEKATATLKIRDKDADISLIDLSPNK
jgi:uncharacterized lipoprotein